MKIATYNINGINGHLEILLRWLNEAQRDIVCLQELKCENNKFPIAAIQKGGLPGYLAWSEKLEWCCYLIKNRDQGVA